MREAVVGIEDRGLQFADSIYEVWRVADGRLRDRDGHYARLVRSLGELRMEAPMGRAALENVLQELVRRNRVRNGLVYLQVTRGEAPRDHVFPVAARPAIIATAKSSNSAAIRKKAEQGVAVITQPDIRWGRCDIKTTALLPNVLAKQAAKDQGAAEAWLVDADGDVTEGSSTNAWIVTGGRLVTRAHADNILNGVTRLRTLDVAKAQGAPIELRPFSVEEAKAAGEAFITSASGMVLPVVAIDGARVGDGKPGPITRALQSAYLALED
jgi:D-alanine transaminase